MVRQQLWKPIVEKAHTSKCLAISSPTISAAEVVVLFSNLSKKRSVSTFLCEDAFGDHSPGRENNHVRFQDLTISEL
jgi:hypothetical protein